MVNLSSGQLDAFSLEGLIDLTKQTLFGPKTWSPLCPSPPSVARRQWLRVKNLDPRLRTISFDDDPLLLEALPLAGVPRMLPGGRYIMYHNAKKLECYSLVEEKLVWRYISSSAGDVVDTYTTDMMDYGRAVVIMVGLHYEGNPSIKFVETVRLDLNSYVSQSLLYAKIPKPVVEHGPNSPPALTILSICELTRPRVCGDFAAIILFPFRLIFILNIKTRLTTMFHLNDVRAEYDIALFPGYLAVLETTRCKISLKVWNTQALIDIGETARLEDVSPIMTIPFDNPTLQKRPRVCLSCHASPLESDTYTLWALVSTRDTTTAYYRRGTIVSKFELSLCPTPALRQTMLKYIDGEEYSIPPSSDISYTGHVGALDAEEGRMLILSLAHMPLPSKKGGVLGHRNLKHGQLSPYGIAEVLTEGADNIVVNYYN